MPHQCVRCGKLYDDGASELLEGCSCGSNFFFYMKKKESFREIKLTDEEKKEVEHDVLEIVGYEEEKPIILDLENIRVLKPGKYEFNLVDIFRGKPLIYKVADGKYVIDISSVFKMKKNKVF